MALAGKAFVGIGFSGFLSRSPDPAAVFSCFFRGYWLWK